MEPSSTNSSEHEMQQIPPTYPTPSVQPEQATGKTRVRFNSSANVEVPPPPLEQIRSYSRVSESGSNEITTNQHTVDAEELLNAHNAGELNAQNFNALPLSEVDPDGAYTVTGNANGGVFY